MRQMENKKHMVKKEVAEAETSGVLAPCLDQPSKLEHTSHT